MYVRDVSRLICIFALLGATLVAAVSCGGSGSGDAPGDASIDSAGIVISLDGTAANRCTPKTCAEQGFTCGPNSDGCGNVIPCGSCTGSAYCGGGGYSKCGNPSLTADGGSKCQPKTCADFPAATCGQQSDGCGGLTANCSTCSAPEFCGGGGPSTCGTGSGSDGGTTPCSPKTCADYPGTCGAQSDGCGNLTPDCGGCVSPLFCGGGATPGVCGGNDGFGPDGGVLIPPCVPKTCAELGNPCGVAGDGCGGLTPTCTTCTSPAYCGGGGPSMCGTGSGGGGGNGDGGNTGTCTPKTCAAYPANTCGSQSDGCGGLTPNCGTCTNPAYCGGLTPGVCGGNDGKSPDGGIASACIPKTCAALGYNCGQAGDGCGGTIGPCGPACITPQVCGGGGNANVCGSNVACTGLCQQQVACDSGATTTLVGTVVAATPTTYLPAGVTLGDPVPNVLVYVPNGAVQPFIPRATETAAQQCTVCGADVTGEPLVLAYTKFDGTFSLPNVPVGGTIPVVIQLGRWRRQFTVSVTNPCGTNTVNDPSMPAGILKMPNNQMVGDIPLTAISTGQVDALECVLLKMGIDTTEFTTNAAATPGRVNIFMGNGSDVSGGGAPSEASLMDTGGTFNAYDQILLPCWGAPITKDGTELGNLITYADTGGHFFATHYSYTWLFKNAEFQGTAQWDVGANASIPTATGTVSQAVPLTHPGVFVEWLNLVQALSNFTPQPQAPPNPAHVTIDAARHDVDQVLGNSVDWIDGTDPAPHRGDPAEMLLHYTFDTPVTPAAGASQCGHVIFSDFHVANNNTSGPCTQDSDCATGQCNGNNCARKDANCTCSTAQFPVDANLSTYCGTTPMTAQEKVLEYMIWDLGSCVPGSPSATCTAKTCTDYPTGTCGQQGDGCGGLTADCGGCPTGQVCGGGGVSSTCGAPDAGTCTPATCAAFAGMCGQQSDGCGGLTATCTCPAGQTCGGGGNPGACGSPPDAGSSGGCVPMTCAAYPTGTCGRQADGCGALTPDCNPCPMGQTCGGCGVSGQCCTPPSSMCTPQPCPSSVMCGPATDGCGGVIASCGTCTPPQTCGGGGVSGQCGGNSGCAPLTCAQQNIACGPAGDGCGNLIPNGCGACPMNQTCGGGGVSGQCGGGGTCTPQTCAQLNINCGPAGDGCGNLIPSCGTCTPPDTCGGSGTSGVCGVPVVH
jgi:hypothetical protein